MEYFTVSLIICLCLIGIAFCAYKIYQLILLRKSIKSKLSDFRLPGFIKRYIRIDSAFTVNEKILILDALAEWERKTSGLVEFEITTINANELYIGDHELPQDVPKHVNNNEVFSILKTFSNNSVIKNKEEKSKLPAYGYANWGLFLYISIVVDRIPDDEVFRIVVMHEIGHLLGMVTHLEEKKTLMYKYVNRNAYTLTVQDLTYFLKCYKTKNTYSVFKIRQRLLKKKQRLQKVKI